MTCKNCGGNMVGDGYSMARHCETVDLPSDAEPDISPIYCAEITNRVLRIITTFDAITCLRDDYDVADFDSIVVRPRLVLTAEQQSALVKLRARIRKRLSRAGKTEILLPLPKGTGEALERVMRAAGFDDARDLIAFQIHRLDELRERDGHSFKAQAVRTVTVGDLSKYVEQIGQRHDVRRLATGEYACSCGRQWDADEGNECPGVRV